MTFLHWNQKNQRINQKMLLVIWLKNVKKIACMIDYFIYILTHNCIGFPKPGLVPATLLPRAKKIWKMIITGHFMERTKFEYSDSPAHTRPSAQINKRLHVSLLDGHFIFHKSMQGARNGSVGRVVSHTIITGFLSGKTTGVRSKDR